MLIVLLFPLGVLVLLVYLELLDYILGLALVMVVAVMELLIVVVACETCCFVPIFLKAYDIFRFPSGGFD
jgi:hypothetical protein